MTARTSAMQSAASAILPDAVQGSNTDGIIVDMEEGANDSLVPVAILVLMGVSITVVNYSLQNHSGNAKTYHDLYLMPGIFLLVASSLGISYLFYVSVCSQFEVNSISEAMGVIMKLPPIVYAMAFLATVVPGIEVYLHPANH